MATETTRGALAYLAAHGYEEVGEGGGKLWELYRGGRVDCVITDVVIAPGGKSLFVKIGKKLSAKEPSLDPGDAAWVGA